MTSPAALAADPMPNPPANAEKPTRRQDQFLHPKIIAREAAKVLAEKGLEVRPAQVRLLVKRFVESGQTSTTFRDWFIGHADPTGETAVRHVMTERGF